MTLLPSDKFGVRGHPGNAYDVNDICAHPRCSLASAHAHHVWSRSFLRGQPYEWVRFDDGTVIGNRLGFCQQHHAMLTGEIGGYRARLAWEEGMYVWYDRVEGALLPDGWQFLDALSAQPPAAGQRDPHEDAHGMLKKGEQCPVCGHVRRTGRERTEPRAGRDPARPRRDWVVSVPDDAEIGAQLLDDWVEDFAIPLEASDWSMRQKRYHVLSIVLAWAMIHRAEFVKDVAAAAERRLAS